MPTPRPAVGPWWSPWTPRVRPRDTSSPDRSFVGVDSLPVRTMAELRARLYVLDPGDPVALSLEQPSGTKVVTDVVLAGSS